MIVWIIIAAVVLCACGWALVRGANRAIAQYFDGISEEDCQQ